MTSVLDEGAPALSRRQFGRWGLAAAATGVAGCGGGGGAIVEPPAAASGLEMVAGALGGSGFALQQGVITRLPTNLTGPAFNSKGDFQFVGAYNRDVRLGRKPQQGASSYAALSSEGVVGQIFDALDRYLVTVRSASGQGEQIAFVQGDATLTVLAGGAGTSPLRDGRGADASINHFSNPLLAKDGLVYFTDIRPDASKVVLRSLSVEGVVSTLLELPNGSRLMESPSGGVRRFTHALYPAELMEWADLVTDGYAYTWQTVSQQWPFDRAAPLAKVAGTADVYWAESITTLALAQVDLSGRWLAVGWKLPGPLYGVAVKRSSPGSLFVTYGPPAGYEGVGLAECRLEMPSTVVYNWLGVPANRGFVDGGAQQARFNFRVQTAAVGDGDGGLLLLEYQDASRLPAIRTVSASGQVGTWPEALRADRMALAYGYAIAFESSTNTLIRAPKSGQGSWQPWVTSSYFLPEGPEARGIDVLRTDASGLLWFAKCYVPRSIWTVPGGSRGNSIVGTVDASGQVRIVAGDPQALYTPETYPLLAQRPWYMDITDMAFEGGNAPVSWFLCNRFVLDDAGKFVRVQPELVRADTAGRQTFVLPAPDLSSASLASGELPYLRLCTLPGRPGEIFLSSACGVHRWTLSKGMELLAGQASTTPGGVVLGALPGGLNQVMFIAPGPDQRSLYVGSENSVMKLVLPV